MTITEEDWQELESPHQVPGRAVRRLHPNSAVDIFLSVDHPSGRRKLVLRSDAHSADEIVRGAGRLPRTTGIEMQVLAASRLEYELQLVLLTGELQEVFNPLVADVATTAAGASTAAVALSAAVDRFVRWQELLRAVEKDGLGTDARRGLFGELLVLGERLLGRVPDAQAVEAWSGPTGANQDFQLPRVAIEVKTTAAKRPLNIRIASERQLDDTGTPSLLLCLVTLDERRGGTGQSLNQRVDAIRRQLSSRSDLARFDALLVQAGYLSVHHEHYDEPRYTQREQRFWHVGNGFPRLVESDLQEGVSDCTYLVAVSGLDRHRATDEDVAALIGGADD